MLLETEPTVSAPASSAALGDLVSAIADELNNPLTVILAYAELLESLDPDERARAVAAIKLEAQRAASVIRRLLRELPQSGRSLRPLLSLEDLTRRAVSADAEDERPLVPWPDLHRRS